MEALSLLSWFIFFTVFVYFLQKWIYSYWKRKGLEYIEPEFFYGNTRSLAKLKVSMGEQFAEIYNQLKRKGYKHGGGYTFFRPFYMPVDLDIIKNILTKDFDHFVNHGTYCNEKMDPLSCHLFNLEDEKWRRLRAKMSSSFTSGKIKMMYQTLFACSGGLKDILTEYANLQDAVDIKEILCRFTTDVIGSVAFGIECNSLKNPDSAFRENGKKIFDHRWITRVRQLMTFVFPNYFLHAVNFKALDGDMEEFFMNAINSTIQFREANNIYRKDFMHLMIQLKNRGKVTDDEFITKQDGEEDGPDFINFNELAAQCFLFFIAGFETSATTMTFALLELALNQNIQETLRNEIKSIIEKYNGELTYDAIKEMKYLDQVVYETLRKHPPAPVLPRRCTKPYAVPGTTVVIEKGIAAIVPLLAIQHDPDNYPDPDKFDPERFSEENKTKRHPCAFLSFGEGPRYCLGSRFGLLQTKVGIISVLRHFKVDVHKKTQLPIKYITNAFILAVDGGVWLTVSKVD